MIEELRLLSLKRRVDLLLLVLYVASMRREHKRAHHTRAMCYAWAAGERWSHFWYSA